MVWAGFIISLNYISLPGISSDKAPKDITFIASVFTGCLATFNVTPGGKKKKDDKVGGPTASVPTQIIRIEKDPLKITTDTKKNVKQQRKQKIIYLFNLSCSFIRCIQHLLGYLFSKYSKA